MLGAVEVMHTIRASELGSTIPGKVQMQTGSPKGSPERAGQCEVIYIHRHTEQPQ